MGLDQYLYRKDKDSKEEYGTEVAYWRKHYGLREWFIEHIPEMNSESNGDTFPLTKELLEELLSDCRKTLEDVQSVENSNLLDRFDLRGIEGTIEALEQVLNTTDFETQVVSYNDDY